MAEILFLQVLLLSFSFVCSPALLLSSFSLFFAFDIDHSFEGTFDCYISSRLTYSCVPSYCLI